MPIFLTRRGATPFIVGFVSAIALLSYGLGQYPAGWLADRFDRRRIVALATLAYASFFVVYLLPLPLRGWIARLVVPTQEKHDFRAVSVTKHP